MDRKEFALFVSALKTYYPREKLLPNEQAMQLWYSQLKDIPYKVAEVVLNKWVATNKWSPSIADIREQAAELMQEQAKDWGEAWQIVIKSIGKYGSYREQDALDSFDELTRATVQRIGYRNLCFSDNLMADRANFRIIYEQLAQRKKQDAQIPQSLKQIISNMPLMIEGGQDGAL